jgi:hypothetical protein
MLKNSFKLAPINYYQHGKNVVTPTTTTKQAQSHNPNPKQTLKNNQKKRLCTQNTPTTTKKKTPSPGHSATFRDFSRCYLQTPQTLKQKIQQKQPLFIFQTKNYAF